MTEPLKKTTNPVALEMRRIFCCAGAAFAGPTLQKGWVEIERLEAEKANLRKLVSAHKQSVLRANREKAELLAELEHIGIYGERKEDMRDDTIHPD